MATHATSSTSAYANATRPKLTGSKLWQALPYVKNASEAVSHLLTSLGFGVAHRPEATIRCQLMRPKDPLPQQETSGIIYRVWCSCGQSNFVGETGRLLLTRMAEHAAAAVRRNANSQVAAHSTGPGHTFKFDEGELLESWFSDHQSINKRNDLPAPSLVLKLCLGKVVSHAENVRMATAPGANVGEPNYPTAQTEAKIRPTATRLRTIIAPHATACDERGNR
ncbi:unnamed protein product [Schistocephalus solidus]|uniref:Uncharacterized protein n=1 Tax=Schistocephalus solidus TaxID=70667 RepID=A0A183T4X6_SCHSO|nr:unnamed protein product [Schistocephalus solidus]